MLHAEVKQLLENMGVSCSNQTQEDPQPALARVPFPRLCSEFRESQWDIRKPIHVFFYGAPAKCISGLKGFAFL
jgi:hypothetical protein